MYHALKMSNYPTFQHEWFERVWNQGDANAIDELCHADVLGHGLYDADGNEVRGVEAFKDFYHRFKAAFPDIRVDVLDSVQQGEMMCANCVVRATHTGPGFFVEPTGTAVEFTGLCLVRVQDRKILESWNQFDFLKVMLQIGAISLNVS